MASKDRCPRCGAMVLPTENYCPQCGAKLAIDAAEPAEARPFAEPELVPEPLTEPEGVSDAPETYAEYAPGTAAAWTPGSGAPRTIEALKAFCAYNEMPLEQMRFFVGVDYREPRAFGIYREDDQFIVYKNKADGSRAVRYHGPDEAYAVSELYAKLLDECHKRDIWPDGRPEGYKSGKQRAKRDTRLFTILVLIFCLVGTFYTRQVEKREHAHDGYYRFDDEGLYYRYGNDWYFDDLYTDWVLINTLPYDEEYDSYYVGDTYDSDWGYSDFQRSEAWESIQEESRTHSEDYGGWDSNDTDWDTDW